MPSEILLELGRMPVGYLDDVMMFHNFSEAWQRFNNTEDKDKESLAKEHELYEVCREVWYERNSPKARKARRKQQP